MATHRGTRSKTATDRRAQKRLASRYIWQTSYDDRLIHEVVCTVTSNQINNFVATQLTDGEPQVYWADNDGYQDGLVLANQLQYEFFVNAPSQTRVSDMVKLSPVEKYQAPPTVCAVPTHYHDKVYGEQWRVGWLKVSKKLSQ